MLFQEINRQLELLGLKVKKAMGAVVDATIIQSAARPKRTIETPACDREEPLVAEQPSNYLLKESADLDAKWLVKGKRAYFGYKGFVIVDAEKGFIDQVHVTPANKSECRELPHLLDGVKAERLLADKGYASQDNRRTIRSKRLKDGIMHKAVRGSPLKYSQKIFNKLISKRRYIIEQGFGTLKRRFHFARASYMSRMKVEGQFLLKAICFNLLKAINQVRFVQNNA